MKRQIGSVTERPKGSGRWQLKWYDKTQDKYYTKTISAKNETEARKMLGKVINEYEPSKQKEASKLTVAELLEKFLCDYSVQQLRRTTLQRYTGIIRNDLIPHIGKLQASKITATDITDFYSWALEHGRKDGKGGLSARTVLHIHSLLSKSFGLAVKRKWVKNNPLKDVDAPSPAHVEMQTLTAEQVVECLEIVKGTKLELPCLLAVYGFMRRGEINGLQWDCVDLERKTITVRRSLEEVKEGLFLGDTKTVSSRRTIPITETLVQALIQEKDRQAERKAYLGELYEDRGFVCAEEDGRPIRPKSLSTAFKQVINKSGLPRIRFHDLSRHTPATIMMTNGENPKVVQERLGHSSFSVTMNTYSHVAPSLGREAAERYERVLQEAATRNRK